MMPKTCLIAYSLFEESKQLFTRPIYTSCKKIPQAYLLFVGLNLVLMAGLKKATEKKASVHLFVYFAKRKVCSRSNVQKRLFVQI